MIDQRIWGKYIKSDKEEIAHPLVCHCIDVAMVTMVLWHHMLPSTKQIFVDAFGISRNTIRQWVLFICALHDIGKCTPAFVVKTLELMPSLFRDLRKIYIFKNVDTNHHFHNTLGATLFVKFCQETGILTSDDILFRFAAIITGHHGVYSSPDRDSVNLGAGEWIVQQRELFEFFVELFGVKELQTPRHPPKDIEAAYFIISRLLTTADWIASNEEFFSFVNSADLEQYPAESFRLAKEAVKKAGFSKFSVKPESFNYNVFFDGEPNHMQAVCQQLAKFVDEPSLIIVENIMGSGKSEASWCLIDGMIRNLKYEGFYYGMPTRATGNAMYKRMAPFVRRLAKNQDFHLSHGFAKQNLFYLRHIRDFTKIIQNNDIYANEWFTRPKCKMLAPCGVGTIDQVELACLRSMHPFMRMGGLANKVVVADEVHALDTYMTTVLQEDLKILSQLKVSVILLSATLTKQKREDLIRAYCGKSVKLRYVDYPRITYVTKSGKARSIALDKPEEKHIGIKIIKDDYIAMASTISRKLKPGAVIGVYFNITRRPREFARILRQMNPNVEIIVIHSHFPVEWREKIEERILSRAGKTPDANSWGKDGRRENERPIVIIGTQILEQSLDLDFDFLMTDLCPLDLLLQRLGRLWRHADKIRPFRQPRCEIINNATISGSGSGRIPDFSMTHPYSGYLMLRAYLKVIREHRKEIVIPNDIEPFVEFNYSTIEPTKLPKVWKQTLARNYAIFRALTGQDKRTALLNTIPTEGVFSQIYNGMSCEVDDEVVSSDNNEYYLEDNYTRIIRDNINIVFVRKKDDGKLYLLNEDTVFNPDVKPDVELSRKLNGSIVTVTFPEKFAQYCIDDVRNNRGKDHPWYKHPLLHRCMWIALNDTGGRVYTTTIAGYGKRFNIILDRELGLEITQM